MSNDTKEPSKNMVITATRFRIILSTSFILMLVGLGAFITFTYDVLKKQAVETQAVVVQADTIDQTNNRTYQLWNQLQGYQSAVDKADQVVAESKSYQYQDTIVRDINEFAKKAGIKVEGYDFTASKSGQPTTGGSSSSSSQESAAATNSTSGSGLKTTAVSITVETPVNYIRLLSFLHYIEQNLTRMQIANVSLNAVGNSSSYVTTSALVIEVYIR